MKKWDYVYVIVYIVLALVGTFLSTHLFDDHRLMVDFYVYYTNLSNYFCLVIMCLLLHHYNRLCKAGITRLNFAAKYGQLKKTNADKSLIETSIIYYKKSREKTHSMVNNLPNYLNGLMFVAAQLIFITFCVYNLLLADFSIINYWTDLYNILFHIILPVMFVVYAIIKCNCVGIWWTFVPTLTQLAYILLVYLRSLIVSGVSGRVIYPYFFLNFATLGAATSLKWVMYMIIISAVVTLILWITLKLKQKIKIMRKNFN